MDSLIFEKSFLKIVQGLGVLRFENIIYQGLGVPDFGNFLTKHVLS